MLVTLEIRSHTDFHGPNAWHRSPVIHLIVEIDTERDALCEVPDLAESYATLAERVHEGTARKPRSIEKNGDLAATIALMALNLQRIAGASVDFSFGQQRVIDDGHDVVVQCLHPQVGLGAARLAVRWVAHLLGDSAPDFDLIEEFRRFTVVAISNDHDVMGRSIASAATQRGIPQTVVDPQCRIVEFGNGRYRKRIVGASTSQTSSIGTWMSRDKHLTNHYLREAGLPVPESIVARSLPQALAAARTIGYPVVIKPLDLAAAVGVVLDLRDDDDVRARFEVAADAASRSTGKVVVERFVPGHDYRALVVDETIVGVSRRLHPQVTGDGVHTIRQLIEIENRNPRRGTRDTSVYKQIAIDDRVLKNLERVELTLDDVPLPGQEVVLNKSGHRRDGAIHVDVTDTVHPANAALVRTAMKIVGLDLAGIDVVAPDISRSIWETGGAIIEINDSPAFNLHLFPGAGPVRDPGPAIMDMLFPPGQPVRVPVVAVAADAASGSICRLLACAASIDRRSVGLATRDGVFIDGTHYRGVDGRNPTGPRTILNNPDVELAIVEVDGESIVEHGLAFDRCDMAIILSLSGAQTPFGEPVEVVLLRALEKGGMAILSGKDPAVRALAGALPHTLDIIWIDTDETSGEDATLVSRAVITAAEGLHLSDASLLACFAQKSS